MKKSMYLSALLCLCYGLAIADIHDHSHATLHKTIFQLQQPSESVNITFSFGQQKGNRCQLKFSSTLYSKKIPYNAFIPLDERYLSSMIQAGLNISCGQISVEYSDTSKDFPSPSKDTFALIKAGFHYTGSNPSVGYIKDKAS